MCSHKHVPTQTHAYTHMPTQTHAYTSTCLHKHMLTQARAYTNTRALGHKHMLHVTCVKHTHTQTKKETNQ